MLFSSLFFFSSVLSAMLLLVLLPLFSASLLAPIAAKARRGTNPPLSLLVKHKNGPNTHRDCCCSQHHHSNDDVVLFGEEQVYHSLAEQCNDRKDADEHHHHIITISRLRGFRENAFSSSSVFPSSFVRSRKHSPPSFVLRAFTPKPFSSALSLLGRRRGTRRKRRARLILSRTGLDVPTVLLTQIPARRSLTIKSYHDYSTLDKMRTSLSKYLSLS